MNKIKQSIFILLLPGMAILPSCNKSNDLPGVASLIIFNGMVGADTLTTNFDGGKSIKWYNNANFVRYGYPGEFNSINSRENNKFHSYSGTQNIALFHYPDTLAHSKPVITLSVRLPANSINSLFLAGTVTAPDTVFTRDQVPYHPPSDSTTSVRVVNLVKGLTASVNLQGEASGSQLASLGYKQVSTYKNYQVNGAGQEYVFEIRDVVTGDLITTTTADARDISGGIETINLYRYRSFSLVIFGELGNTGEGIPSAVILPNY